MDKKQKIELAMQALEQHEELYETEIPDRIHKLWKSGEAFKYDGKCIPAGTKIPLFEDGSFRLAAIPPSWSLLGDLGGLDDALSGPDGEWKAAGNFLPLFGAEQGKVLVVRLDDPKCPVGWYEDETFDTKDKGYKDGVFMLAPSLDQFLAMLTDVEVATYETEREDELWEDAAEQGDDDDEEEDEEDEDDDDED